MARGSPCGGCTDRGQAEGGPGICNHTWILRDTGQAQGSHVRDPWKAWKSRTCEIEQNMLHPREQQKEEEKEPAGLWVRSSVWLVH